MAEEKISEMAAAAALDGTELVPLVQTGDNVQDDLAAVAAYTETTLRVFENGEGTVVDAATPGFISLDLADVLPTNAVTLATHLTVTSARMATQTTLPTCDYDNGSSGVGATLTANPSVALNTATGVTDHVAPVAGDRLLVKNQASAFQNGIYTATQVTSPFILTRVAEADVAADYLDGIACKISEGVVYKGAEFTAAGAVTMGTAAILWEGTRPSESPTDAYFSLNRDRRRFFSDFQFFETALTPNASLQRIGNEYGFWCSIPTTATAGTLTQQSGDSGNALGVLSLETGTAATGNCHVIAGQNSFTFSSSRRWAMGCRLRIPTLTDGTETFLVRMGFSSDPTTGVTPTSGIFFEAVGDGGNWDCVSVAASTETRVDSGQAPATTYRDFAIYYDEITATAYFYMQVSGTMTEVSGGGISTNIPSSTGYTAVTIDKSAGTTSRVARLDYFSSDQLETRSATSINMAMLP